jgi:hypothetical protein
MSDDDKDAPEPTKHRTSVHVLVLINIFNWRPHMPAKEMKEPPAQSMSKRSKAKARRAR